MHIIVIAKGKGLFKALPPANRIQLLELCKEGGFEPEALLLVLEVLNLRTPAQETAERESPGMPI